MISSFEGVLKPDSRMYETAINRLQIKPKEAIFVDDNLNNCFGAMNVGIKAVLLCRDEKKYIEEKNESVGKGYQVINNLTQLYDLL